MPRGSQHLRIRLADAADPLSIGATPPQRELAVWARAGSRPTYLAFLAYLATQWISDCCHYSRRALPKGRKALSGNRGYLRQRGRSAAAPQALGLQQDLTLQLARREVPAALGTAGAPDFPVRAKCAHFDQSARLCAPAWLDPSGGSDTRESHRGGGHTGDGT